MIHRHHGLQHSSIRMRARSQNLHHHAVFTQVNAAYFHVPHQ
ncbi:hypothetical protein PMI16_03487 [Herbaspirillum sp. CF444]|nr:hypothetical protein PMI16_03487 [Herbaspirillum sp. CF444]